MPRTLTDYVRIALYVALVGVLLIMFQTWDKDHPKAQHTAIDTSPTQLTTNTSYVPSVTDVTKSSQPIATTATVVPATNKKMIHVMTDVMDVEIDPLGGNVSQVKLLHYPETLHSTIPFTLLTNASENKYIAQSGLLSPTGPDTQKGQALYQTKQTEYTLANGQKELQVELDWKNANGVLFKKIFTFQPNSYQINLTYQIENASQKTWNGNLYLQLMRKNVQPTQHGGFVSFATYFGAAISSPEKRFQKITFKNMQNTNLSQTITGGWAAMVQHYFVSAWVPEKNANFQYFSRVTPDGLYTIGMIGPKLSVSPGETMTTTSKLYSGPSIASNLEKTAPGLQLTIDYGWFWIISEAIFWMMQHIYNFIGNWGWSIVIVTLIIKLMFYHLSAKSYRSMSGLKKIQPRINALKERFGDDKQKFTQATLELYKKEKVNPMSGCLPIIVQIPVFIALYWVLIESVQLRQAPFILWIHDLSTKDPYYILPLLVGLSMFLQQRLNPPPPDPTQAKVMMFMPVVFTALFLKFPAGLMLYWFVNNTLSFLQQWYIMRSINKS